MYKEILRVAQDAAIKAGELLKIGYGTAFTINSKEGLHNLVTEYDIKSENIIIETLKAAFPDSTFLAEESGELHSGNSGNIKWIVDPLDGTVNFAHNIPIFSVSIAAEIANEIVVGVIYQPLLNELFTATKDGGAYLNRTKIQVTDIQDLKSAFLVTGFPYKATSKNSRSAELFINVVQQGIPIRRLGSAALDLAYVAAGRFDGFWELELNPWDVAAGVLLIREAGGNVTQYDMSKYSVYDKSILATNGLIHQAASDFLSKKIL
ncbi:MAG: hypothetical protein A2X64_02600 [Ignavibacteria bacterium GWF2_33_9]|nr:MAG: hypothetical protein A2X64_02600 [Ignavibacteria bacterium GWF2_33_9]